MLIKATDIQRKEGNIKLPQLGGEVLLGYAKVSMHNPTGVVFIQIFKDDVFEKYVVGVMSSSSTIDEQREYVENTEKNFFDAVKYFEELIEKLMPQDQDLPSIARFYFYKDKLNKDCKVVMPGAPEIIIQRMDIPLIFTPPQSKPYGRLDMTIVDKPEYEIISSKFALKYNEEATKQDEGYNQGLYLLEDFAVYDMTPYQNNETQQGEDEETPEDVNDNKLDPNDIEGEDLNDKKQKDKKKSDKNKGDKKDGKDGEDEEGDDKSEQKKKSDKKGQYEDEEPTDEDGEPTDEDGEPTDEEGEPTDRKSKKSDKEGEDGEPTDEEGEPIDEPSKEKQKPENAEQRQKTDKPQETSDEEPEKIDYEIVTDRLQKEVTPNELIPSLEQMFNAKQGLKDMFKKQNRLLGSLDSFNQEQLSVIYNQFNIPQNYPKQEFINLVKDKTQTIF